MAKKSLTDLINEQYDSQEVRNFIAADVEQAGTGPAIVQGLCTLPTEQDALAHIERERIRKEKEAARLRGGV